MVPCNIGRMAYREPNWKALEAAVGGLEPGGRLSNIDRRVLERAFGLNMDVAVEAAQGLAKRHECVFHYDSKQVIGEFVKPDG